MSFLERILAEKKAEVRAAKHRVPEAALLAVKRGERRDFTGALHKPGLSVIAEIKRASPSKGPLAAGLDLTAQLRRYEQGGAAAVSILTDGPHFGGNLTDLASARNSCSLPLLRKDFLIDPYQLLEAACWGADAVLLIVAALSDRRLAEMQSVASQLGLAALVEVHDEREMERAIQAGAKIIGVNNRDLHTFELDLAAGLRLLPMIPRAIVRVAESGIHGPAEAATLQKAGADAILVGESLVGSSDPAALIRRLREGIACSSRSAG